MSRSCTLGETGAAGSHHVTVIIVDRRAWKLLEVGEMSRCQMSRFVKNCIGIHYIILYNLPLLVFMVSQLH